MWWVIVISSLVILIINLVALYSTSLLQWVQAQTSDNLQFKTLAYLLNIIIPLLMAWWYISAYWALIWLLETVGKMKLKTSQK